MKILTASNDDNFVVRITGDIDHHSAFSIREEIDGIIALKQPKNLILDLSETDFMDSSGLGLILGRFRKTREMGINLIIVNPTDSIMKILLIAGADKILDIRKV